ncbi:hypothetical protein K443DRAFT_674605 [Laccaria amethystina LaAM-08-1]|uniref:Uncharacterized protein n=1 Tax=Laccaria amethystina LaAM-08-1 TaxID=1095629 RepID=A0A0C9XLW8_9AGAR|nr:hypothetical protein K443DRAFT_674605 [Laccaria amethystina LaAM-08-1]
MKAVNQVCFILFVPGSRDGITGYSPKITYTKDEDKDGGIAHDKALAEDYDMKLSEEVRRIRTAGAVARKKVAGWQSSTLKSTLQDEQMYEVILKLPEDHPAYVAMMQGVRRAIYG